jgi:hypothetical protein
LTVLIDIGSWIPADGALQSSGRYRARPWGERLSG